jgi:hypothetical protein
MYLRRHRRRVEDTTYEYWTLVESRRTASGPRQHTVATLGKLPGLDEPVPAGWDSLEDLLEGRAPARQLELTGHDQPAAPLWREVNVRGVRVERVREFGEVYLAPSLWRRLGLHTFLNELLPPGREEVPWERIACLLTVARFCAQPSELGVAERWYQRTALEDLLGVSWEKINDDRLYRGLDALHQHKEKLTQHLLQRYESWFGVGFEFLIYDVTSTFFEGQVAGNPQAARGYSRDNRPDCKQVCIGLVVSPEGLPLAYEVLAGNRADVTTVEDIVRVMEEKYGQAKRIWVLDRGMVSEETSNFCANIMPNTSSVRPRPSCAGLKPRCSKTRTGNKCVPTWKSNSCPIPMVRAGSSSSCAAARPGARRKKRCWPGRRSVSGKNFWKSTSVCKRSLRPLPQSNGAWASGWGAIPPPTNSSRWRCS